MPIPFSTILAFFLAGATTLPAAAQTSDPSGRIEDSATFDVTLRGINAGLVQFAGAREGNRYMVTGRVESTGLAAFVRKFTFMAEASGRVANDRYTPSSYNSEARSSAGQRRSTINYRAGVPVRVVSTPSRESRPHDVDPTTLPETVDPATALHATLLDVAPGRECAASRTLFDGVRVSRITLSQPRKDGETVTCTGDYSRIAGYRPEDMAKRTRFPFTLTYAPTPEGRMRVIEVSADTLYGKAVMKRR